MVYAPQSWSGLKTLFQIWNSLLWSNEENLWANPSSFYQGHVSSGFWLSDILLPRLESSNGPRRLRAPTSPEKHPCYDVLQLYWHNFSWGGVLMQLKIDISFWAFVPVQLPRGTHEWSKLVTPEELVLMLQKASVSVSFQPLYHTEFDCKLCCWYLDIYPQVEEMAGFVYNPLSGEWSLSDDISVNYIAFGVKKGEASSTNDREANLS